MAEILHDNSTSRAGESRRIKRKASVEVEPIEGESQALKRHKTVASTPDIPQLMTNPDNTTLSISGRQQSSVLAIPHLDDTIDQLSLKLLALAKVIVAGESIATATAFSAAPMQETSASKAATAQMTPLELEVWTEFTHEICQLPDIDWENCIAPPFTSSKPLKVACRRAEALNRLYKTDRAHEGHIAWITQNRIEILHLIKAQARIIGSERNLVGGRNR